MLVSPGALVTMKREQNTALLRDQEDKIKLIAAFLLCNMNNIVSRFYFALSQSSIVSGLNSVMCEEIVSTQSRMGVSFLVFVGQSPDLLLLLNMKSASEPIRIHFWGQAYKATHERPWPPITE